MNEIYKQLEGINLDLFYCVTIWTRELTLQGNINPEVIDYCKKQFGITGFSLSEQGYLEAAMGHIKIVLT